MDHATATRAALFSGGFKQKMKPVARPLPGVPTRYPLDGKKQVESQVHPAFTFGLWSKDTSKDEQCGYCTPLEPGLDTIAVENQWRWTGAGSNYLDFSICLLDGNDDLIKAVDCSEKTFDSIVLEGDTLDFKARTGSHRVIIRLKTLPAKVHRMVFVASSLKGTLKNFFANHIEVKDKQGYVLTRYGRDSYITDEHNLVVLAEVSRRGEEWGFFSHGIFGVGTIVDYGPIVKTIQRAIPRSILPSYLEHPELRSPTTISFKDGFTSALSAMESSDSEASLPTNHDEIIEPMDYLVSPSCSLERPRPTRIPAMSRFPNGAGSSSSTGSSMTMRTCGSKSRFDEICSSDGSTPASGRFDFALPKNRNSTATSNHWGKGEKPTPTTSLWASQMKKDNQRMANPSLGRYLKTPVTNVQVGKDQPVLGNPRMTFESFSKSENKQTSRYFYWRRKQRGRSKRN